MSDFFTVSVLVATAASGIRLAAPFLLLGLYHIALGRLLRPLVTVRYLGIEVGFIAAIAVFVDPGDPLQAAQRH